MPTQSPTLSGTGNEYQPKCGNTLHLKSNDRYGSFHLWINVWHVRHPPVNTRRSYGLYLSALDSERS